MCSTNLGRFLEVIVNQRRGSPVFSGEREGSERPKSVSSSQKKYRTGNESTLPCDSTVDLFCALGCHMYSGLMPPLLRALTCHSEEYPASLLHKHPAWTAQLSRPFSGYLVFRMNG